MNNKRSYQSNFRVPRSLSFIACASTAILFLTGMTGRDGFFTQCLPNSTDCVVISKLDFTPQDGSYEMKKTGRTLIYANVEHFVVNIGLDRPAPRTFSRVFEIKEDRWNGWTTLGKFTATFSKGSTTPDISYLRKCCGAAFSPTGTPATLTDGTFWMGCTKRGKVKANGKKGNDGDAIIRLEKVNQWDAVAVKGKYSPKHFVQCQ